MISMVEPSKLFVWCFAICFSFWVLLCHWTFGKRQKSAPTEAGAPKNASSNCRYTNSVQYERKARNQNRVSLHFYLCKSCFGCAEKRVSFSITENTHTVILNLCSKYSIPHFPLVVNIFNQIYAKSPPNKKIKSKTLFPLTATSKIPFRFN